MKLLITLLFSIGVVSTSESDIALANYNVDTNVYIPAPARTLSRE